MHDANANRRNNKVLFKKELYGYKDTDKKLTDYENSKIQP